MKYIKHRVVFIILFFLMIYLLFYNFKNTGMTSKKRVSAIMDNCTLTYTPTSFDNESVDAEVAGLILEMDKDIAAPIATKASTIAWLIKKYRVDYQYSLARSPWKIARNWVGDNEIHPEYSPELDVGQSAGKQFKMLLELEGDQKVVLRPKRWERDHIHTGQLHGGPDRHNAEIAAFHLGRLLQFRRTPLCVGRFINVEKEILPVASDELLRQIHYKENSTCVPRVSCDGPCMKRSLVCFDGVMLETALILWLPDEIRLQVNRYPWRHTYLPNRKADWELNSNYCNDVILKKCKFQHGRLLLDLMDMAVFDYLISNGDRHTFETIKVNGTYPMVVLLDNGKSFGSPYKDEDSLITPLVQCCRLFEKTYKSLLTLSGGTLSEVLKSVLFQDPIAPVLTDQHLLAMDRRLGKVLDIVQNCIKRLGIDNVLLPEPEFVEDNC